MTPATLPGGHVVHFWRDGQNICGRATIYTRFGPLHFQAATNLVEMREAVKHAMGTPLGRKVRALSHELILSGSDDTEVAGFFDDVGDFFTKTIPGTVAKIARSDVFQKVANGVSAVLNNPITGPLIGIIPGIGQVAQIAGRGAKLLADAYAGHPQAKAKLKAIKKRAKSGDPKAQKAWKRLEDIRARGLAGQVPQLPAAKPPAPHAPKAAKKATVRFGGGAAQFTAAQLAQILAALPQNRMQAAPAAPDALDPMLAALMGMGMMGDAGDDEESDEIGADRARRVNNQRYDAMVREYRRSNYRIGASGLPISLEAGADGVHRMPRMMTSCRGIQSPYGLRIV